MKKCLRSGIVKLILSLFALGLNFFAACEIGLGESVDVEAPKIEFANETVVSGAVIRDAFAVFGTWEDDGSIETITATLRSLTDSDFSIEREGDLDEENASWKVTFDPVREKISDGPYELSIYIEDSAGHENKISRSITIDNTAPLVVLSRPSTKAGASSFDSYGQKFTLEGKAADDNDVSLIEVNVYSNAACTGDPIKTITLPNVPLTIETDVAEYSSKSPNDYSVIYGQVDASGIARRDGGTVARYCKLVVYDGAQRYPANGSAQTEADKKGNSVEHYYLSNDRDIADLFTAGYKITELYHILNGTYSGSSRSVSTSGVTTLLNDTNKQVTIGQFKLNPENSPKFVVSAKNTLPEDSNGNVDIDFSAQNTPYFITNGNGPLEIEVTPGLDGHIILEETVGLYLLQCSDNGTVLNDNKIWLIEPGLDKHAAQAEKTQSGSTYKFKTIKNIESGVNGYPGLEVNHNYLIFVCGKDQQTNDIMSDGKYGFRLKNTDQNIDVSVPSLIWVNNDPADNDYAYPSSRTPQVTLTFSSLDYQPVNIYRGTDQATVGAAGTSPVLSNQSGLSITDTVPESVFDSASGSFYLYYKVKGGSGETAQSTNPKKIQIKIDNDAPSVTIPNNGVPNATATEQETFTISGTASDNTGGSGVKEVYLQIWDGNGAESSISTPAYEQRKTAAEQDPDIIMASVSGNNWICTITPADWDGSGDPFEHQGKKTVKVTVVDGVGLIATDTKVFDYDKKAPEIKFTDTDDANAINPAAGSYRNSGFTLQVDASDTNGVDKVEIFIDGSTTAIPAALNSTTGKYEKAFVVGQTTPATNEYYLADGSHDFTVRVTDKAGKTKDVARSFTVDTVKPTATWSGVNTWYKSASVRFSVIVTENNVDEIKVSDGPHEEVMSLSAGKYAASLTDLSEGSNTITVTMKDKAENQDQIRTDVYVDLTAPTLNIENNLQYMPSAGFTVNGTTEDSGAASAVSGIASLTVKEERRTWSSTNSNWSNWAATPASGTNGKSVSISNGSWSQHLPLGNVSPSDGQYRYTFTLKDVAGNTTTSSFETTVDTTAPAITIENPNNKTAANAINSSPYMFSGSITEANTVNAIYYKVLASSAAAPNPPAAADQLTPSSWTGTGTNGGWTSITAEKNWSFYREINTTDSSALPEGKYKIYMYALDGAGNLSSRAVKEFHVDMAAPEVTANAPVYVNAKTNSDGSRKVTITGSVTESHGLQSFYIKRNGQSGNGTQPTGITLNTPLNNQSWTYTDTPAADGTYTYTITATDAVGKTNATLPKTVIVDTVADITQVKINGTVVAPDANTSAKWYKAQTIPINVTVGDSTSGHGVSGVASVEYTTLTDTQTASATTLDDSNWTQLSPQTTGYGGSAIFSATGKNQKLYIRVKDNAGNVTYFNTDSTNTSLNEYQRHNPVLINIDTSAPEIGNQFAVTGMNAEAEGQVYVDGSENLVVYGKTQDPESGLNTSTPLTFTIGSTAIAASDITIKYSTADPATVTDMTSSSITWGNMPSDTRTVTMWQATIKKERVDSTDECGMLKVKAKNVADDSSVDTTIFNITYDNTPPVLSNISFESSNTKKPPYKKSETEYYVNNKDDGNPATTTAPTFKIKGIATDNVGVKEITLTVGGTSITRTSTSLNEWEFGNINLGSYAETASALAVVTVKDVAEHSVSKQFTIKFDVTNPKAMHWADAKDKDIYFRIGDADNDKENGTWETGDTAGNGSTAADKANSDVGKKYSFGSWGNNSTIEIRGNFYESETGSGLKAIHYAIFDEIPTTAQVTALENGTLTTTGSAKVVSSFEPLKTPETKRVPYNKASGKTYKDITSNFNEKIAGFDATNNYLVLAAEDYAGNREVDTLAVTQGKDATTKENTSTETADSNGVIIHRPAAGMTNSTDNSWNSSKAYYSIKVDTQDPNIIKPVNNKFYTNGQDNAISLEGITASDALSGIDSVTITIDEIHFEQKATQDTDGSWKISIPVTDFADPSITSGAYTVYAEAKDRAGIGNKKKISAATITVDKDGPTVEIKTPGDLSKTGATFALNGTASDGTGAGVDSTKDLVLYYTTNASAGASAPTALPAAGATAANTWVAYDIGNPTLRQNGREWDLSVNLGSIAPNNANTPVYFSVSATDKSGTGNVGWSEPVMYTVDRKAPAYNTNSTRIGGKTHAQMIATETPWINSKNGTLVVEGAFTDDGDEGSGVTTIIYEVINGGVSNGLVELPTTDGTFNTNIGGFTANSTLKIKAKDAANNTGGEQTYTVKVDGTQPEITEVNTNDFKQVILTNGTASEEVEFYVTDTGSGITEAASALNTVKVGSRTITSGTGTNDSKFEVTAVSGQTNKWHVKITLGTTDLSALSGNNSILVSVNDKSGNESNSQIIGTVNVDTDEPVPSFTSPGSGATVNKKIEISGRVRDDSNSEITNIVLTAESGTGTSKVTKVFEYPAPAASTGKGTITYANGLWSIAELNTADFYNNTSTQALKLSLVATDVANNTTATPVELSLTIDQKTDRPVVKFTNLVEEGSNYILKYGNAATLEGVITDDDSITTAVVKKFFASKDPITVETDWTQVGTSNVWTRPTDFIKTYKWENVKDETNATSLYYTALALSNKATNSTNDEATVYTDIESFKWKDVKASASSTNQYYTDAALTTLAVASGTNATSDNTTVYQHTGFLRTFKWKNVKAEKDENAVSIATDLYFTSAALSSLATSSTASSANVYRKLSEKTEFNVSTGDYKYTPADPDDGTKEVYFYVKDCKDEVFYTTYSTGTTAALKRPYQQFKTNTKADNSAALGYNSDSNAPTINSSELITITPDNTDVYRSYVWKNVKNEAGAVTNYYTDKALTTHPVTTGTTVIGDNDPVYRSFKWSDVKAQAGAKDNYFIDKALTRKPEAESALKEWTVGGKSRNLIQLKVSANDGNGIQKIDIKVGNTTYSSTNSSDGTVKTPVNNSGNYTFTTNKIDISSTTNFPEGEVPVTVLVYDNSGLYSNQKTSFYVDRTAPSIDISTPSSDGLTYYGTIKQNVAAGIITGGDSDTKVYFTVSESNNLKDFIGEDMTSSVGVSASIVFDGGTGSENGYHTDNLHDWVAALKGPSYNIDENDDNVPVYIWYKAVDTCGNFSVEKRLVNVIPNGDKPTVTISYPENKADSSGNKTVVPAIAGTIRLYGTTDIMAYSVDSVYVQLAKYPHYKWENVKNEANSETIYFTDLALTKHPVKTGTNATSDDTIVYNFPSYTWSAVKNQENARSKYYTSIVNATHPDSTTPDTATVYTLCDWDDWRNSLKTMVGNTVYNSTYANSIVEIPGHAGVYGIKTSGTADNWNLPINTLKEFETSNPGVAIRVYAISDSGKNAAGEKIHKLSDPTDQLFMIDATAPRIGGDDKSTSRYSLQLVQFASEADAATLTNIVSRVAYKSDMWVKGNWYLLASVYDDQTGISSITLDEHKNAGIKKFEEGTETTVGSGTNARKKYTIRTFDAKDAYAIQTEQKSGAYNYNICIPLPTGSDSGTVTYTIEATEKSEQNLSCIETVRINYDNTAPKISTNDHTKYDMNANIQQSDGFYNLKGFITDADGNATVSGISGVAFYFMRRGTAATNAVTKVYDPMWKDKSVTVRTGSNDAANIEYSHGLYWKKKTGVTRDENNLNKITLSSSDDNIHAGGLALLGGTIYRISSVNGAVIEVEGEVPLTVTDAYFALALVVDNFRAESTTGRTLKNSASDAGEYGYGYYGPGSGDDGDLMEEYIDGTSVEGQWQAKINSKNIPDGPIELHYVAFDKSQNFTVGIVGNVNKTTYNTYATKDVTANKAITTASEDTTNKLASEYYYSFTTAAYISNNAPRLAGVTVGTDYNGDGNISDTEKRSRYVGEDVRYIGGSGLENQFKKATSVIKEFNASSDGTDNGNVLMTVKDKMEIELEIIGGNGNLFYQYKRDSGAYTQSAAMVAGTDFTRNPAEGVASDYHGQAYYNTTKLKKLEFTEAQLKGWYTANNDKSWWTIEVWDSTEETTPFTNSQNATLKLPLSIQVNDTVAPKTVISPLYWKSATDNSVYRDTKGNRFGHVELAGDLGTSQLKTDYGDDDKISGIVVFKGFAYDNKRLANLKWAVINHVETNTTYTAAQTSYLFPATGSALQNGASFDSGVWTGVTDLDTNHYMFTVSDAAEDGAYLDEKGHKVAWTLTVDTSYIKNVVKKDARIYVYAEDTSGGTTTITNASVVSTSTDQETYDKATSKPTYQVDIVPYITSVDVELGGLKTGNPSVYSRTALGHYTLRDTETVTFHGFNLAGAKYQKTAPAQGVAEQLVNLTGTANNQLAASNITKSGKVVLKVGDLYTINNMNNNDAKGAYATEIDLTENPTGELSTIQNYYNRQPNGDSNNLLTDDVEFDVWQIRSNAAPTISGRASQPVMKINPATGQLGFAYANGPLYFTMGSRLTGGDSTSYDYWMGSYDFFTSIGYTIDKLGYGYGVAAGGDINSSSADHFVLATGRWGTGGRSNRGSYGGQNAFRLEQIAQNNGGTYDFNKERIMSPSLTTAVHGTTTDLYLAYYDDMNAEIRVRAGATASTAKPNQGFGSFIDSFDPGTGNSTPQAYNLYSATVIAGTGTAYTAGEYVSIAVVSAEGTTAQNADPDDVLVLVWYDSLHQVLYYTYNTKPLKMPQGRSGYANVNNTTAFETPTPVFSESGIGEYCKIAVDKNGGIHVAAYDSQNANIKYAYKSGYNTGSWTECVVDEFGIVGSELTLDVAYNTANGSPVPYIGYYATSAVRPKLAYLATPGTLADGSKGDAYTQAWEVSYVPTSSKVPQDHINVGVWKNNGVIANSTTSTKQFANATAATPTGNTINAAQNGNNRKDYDATQWGYVFGNGTANPILGYQIKVGTAGSIETAQKK